MSRETISRFSPRPPGKPLGVIERSPDETTGAVRLTFPVTAADADLNAMVLAGGAEALALEPDQAAGLGLAVATESAAAMARHTPEQSGEMSVGLDFEPATRHLRVTAAERTVSTSSCEVTDEPTWSASSRVEPRADLLAEFAGSTFVRCILPRVLARAAMSADATLDAVTRSTILGDRLAEAVLGLGEDPELEVRVLTERESRQIRIRSSSERVLKAVATVWPGAAETEGAGAQETLVLRLHVPAG